MQKLILVILLIFPFFFMSQNSTMTTSQTPDEASSLKLLQDYAAAFNAHDSKLIMSMMTEDCVFRSSAGNEREGHNYRGHEEVKKAFDEVFSSYPDAKWSNAQHFIKGDRGVSEWIFSGTKINGEKIEVTGCDLFTIRNGKIWIKNSYRKNRIAH
jgi:ketosteroid isomerase-like protein